MLIESPADLPRQIHRHSAIVLNLHDIFDENAASGWKSKSKPGENKPDVGPVQHVSMNTDCLNQSRAQVTRPIQAVAIGHKHGYKHDRCSSRVPFRGHCDR